MSRQVIINADDFGLSPAVNEGIIKAYHAGGITSTSMMVNMPGFNHAVRSAWSLPDFGIGLHFNLTYGRSISDPDSVPSLVRPDGTFHNGIRTSVRDSDDVARELDAQWNRFVGTSLYPAHLDSHHLLHQNDPLIYKVMAEKAIRENIPLRRSQIVHSIPNVPNPLMSNTILLDTYGDQEGLQRLLHHLFSLPEGITEIVCHPGYVDDVLRGISEWTDIREDELSVFINEEVPQTIQALGIVPISYKAMMDTPDEPCELSELPEIPRPSQPIKKKILLAGPRPHRELKRKRKTRRWFKKRGTKPRPSATRIRKRV
ncbi:carbohydrate deacetylase [Paenibacillus taichungensis]|uniref:carbohydrate deacetylase n=1 Tax=Paenibacillus taichungensis TaxID=484184 RepID=UPI0039A71281